MAFDDLSQFITAFFSSFKTDFRLSTCTQASGKLLTYLYFRWCFRAIKGLYICINGDKFNAGHFILNHSVYSVVTATTNADNDDFCYITVLIHIDFQQVISSSQPGETEFYCVCYLLTVRQLPDYIFLFK